MEQTWELRSVTPTLIRQAQFHAFFRHLSGAIRGSPTTRHPESRVSTTPVGTFVAESTVPPITTEDTIEQPNLSPLLAMDFSNFPSLDLADFDPLRDTGLDIWGTEPPSGKLRVHVRVPDYPERTIHVPNERERAVQFLDGLSACGFALEIGCRRGAQGADIYEWHLERPFDEVQATLSPGFVSEYDVPPENQLKRRRRDQDASGAKRAVDDIMAWIDRQVTLSVVEEEL